MLCLHYLVRIMEMMFASSLNWQTFTLFRLGIIYGYRFFKLNLTEQTVKLFLLRCHPWLIYRTFFGCRLFGSKRCSRCLASISSSELVMRARHLVFHIRCFSCAVCNSLLTKGDQFGMRDSSVFCRWVAIDP